MLRGECGGPLSGPQPVHWESAQTVAVLRLTPLSFEFRALVLLHSPVSPWEVGQKGLLWGFLYLENKKRKSFRHRQKKATVPRGGKKILCGSFCCPLGLIRCYQGRHSPNSRSLFLSYFSHTHTRARTCTRTLKDSAGKETRRLSMTEAEPKEAAEKKKGKCIDRQSSLLCMLKRHLLQLSSQNSAEQHL